MRRSVKVRIFMSTPRTIRLSPEDNVVVAVDQIAAGAVAAGVTARERVPRGHKMAIAAIGEGEPVRKYGQIIGFASKPIAPAIGCTSTTSRCATSRATIVSPRAQRTTRSCRRSCARHSKAIVRPNGKAGTRNYIGILTSVNCSASVAKFIAEEVNRSGILDDYPEIDGVVPFVHGTRLRHGGLGRRLRTCCGGPNGATPPIPISARRADGRPRLRSLPDRSHEGRIRPRRRRPFPAP